jgi:hypothetical protein
LIIEGYGLETSVGSTFNARITAGWCVDEVAGALGRVPMDEVRSALRRIAPLVRERWADGIREKLARMLFAGMERFDSEERDELLAFLEGLLPEGGDALLLPFRLASGVLARREPEDLPDQPEEMRRTVAQILVRIRPRL